MEKEYKIREFDRSKIKLLSSIIDYFAKRLKLEAETWNENHGFKEKKTIEELKNNFKEMEKKYTGLDEVTVKIAGKKQFLIYAVMHEDMCIVRVNEQTRKELEKKFRIALLEGEK